MFDDLLSATALIGVAGVLVAATVSIGNGPSPARPPALAARAPATPPSLASTDMPVYTLPRVVVTGQRLRDGDVLADNGDRVRASAGPR